ncbi:unnamed protein product [Euphydryas editha]|uniref:Uncharacterized protein n=1 Tax=Euphydryas editha TaxID=104508 RepID=A0AAU9TUG8_EUPED|nr:unnamed protein product [Euphydryas editha]
MTKGGHSVRFTSAPDVGYSSTVLRNGVPGKLSSLKGLSNSTSCLVMFSTRSQKLLKATLSLWRSSRSPGRPLWP